MFTRIDSSYEKKRSIDSQDRCDQEAIIPRHYHAWQSLWFPFFLKRNTLSEGAVHTNPILSATSKNLSTLS